MVSSSSGILLSFPRGRFLCQQLAQLSGRAIAECARQSACWDRCKGIEVVRYRQRVPLAVLHPAVHATLFLDDHAFVVEDANTQTAIREIPLHSFPLRP